MRRILVFLILLFPVYAYSLEINSSAFNKGDKIPPKYTCDGEDVSPALSWSGVPAETKSFVLICSDPDAPFKPWSHWVVFNIPKEKRALAEGVANTALLDDGSIQGMNDFRKNAYGGPCPPGKNQHRYFFTLYCLDTVLTLDEKSTRSDVLNAVKGHIITGAEIYGIYGR